MANVSRLATPLPKEPSNQSQWRFEPLNTPTEWIESYRPGGLHPIHPGDTLCNGRYTVVCKLGYGAFSTVWLAEDGQQSTLVAIKVARADARQVLEELRLYKRLAQTDANRNHVVLPLDGFQQPGPDGLHQCLVFEPMGPSVGLLLAGIPDPPEDMASFDEPPPPPPPPTSAAETPSTTQITLGRRKALLKQLLLGLDCLHSGAVAHGDLNPGNFLLAIRQFSSEDVRNIRTSCESSGRSGPVRRIDGEQDLWAPRYLYLDHPLVHYVDMEHKVSAKLSDPGAAFTFDKPPIANRCVTPAALRAPEIVLKNDIDHKIDIWSFGCLLYEFFTGNVLFQVSGLTEIPQEENDDDHLLQIIDILGQPPPEIFAKWPRRARYFDEDLQLIRSDVSSSDVAEGEPFRGPSLEEAFEESRPDGMEASECAHVIGLLRSLLQYKPDMRPSTAELLDDEWFQSIGT